MSELAVFILVSIPAFVIIGFSIVDVVRRPDLKLWQKGGWLAVVVLLPAVGTVIYLVARPARGPHPRRGSVRSSELIEAIRRHDRGLMSDADYAVAKQRLVTELAAGSSP